MLELQRQKQIGDRQLQMIQDKVKESDSEVEHIRLRCDKLETQL